MNKKRAIIFDIQRNSYVDGPGSRTTVFFKGCNLHCAWCHNPEGQNCHPEWMFYQERCTNCGECKKIADENTSFACPRLAKSICGTEYTPAEVLRVIVKDKRFYDCSGGGVTFSGGECMLQVDFLEQILRACKENGIHTAVDTAGHVPYDQFERILPYTDLFLYDVKCFNNERHKQYTGVGNELILKNLKNLLSAGIPVWVRIPIIPSVNDTEEEMQGIRALWEKGNAPQKVELLPYHAMGEYKYGALAKTAQSFHPPEEKALQSLKNIFI